MTEQEWLECTDPTPMLEFLRGKASDRKLRLFAAACCRNIWHLLTDARSRKAVEVSELFADGMTSIEELRIIHENASAAAQIAYNAALLPDVGTNEYPASAAKYASDDLRFWDMHHAAGVCAADAEWAASIRIDSKKKNGPNPRAASREAHASLLHCIFGNPFRPVTIDPRWLTSTVTDLAQSVYGEKAFDRMPILADALMDAGCDSEEIINHCRSEGPHVRGCWVVDLLLAKE